MVKFALLTVLFFPFLSEASFPKVDGLIQNAISHKTIPGATLIVGQKDRPLKISAYGKKNRTEAATMETLYDLASLTKIFTATSILILEEHGRLKTSDRLGRYLPEFREDDKAKITIDDLLRHRAGLQSGLSSRGHKTLSEYISTIAKRPLAYTPRTDTVYSDLSFIILGHLVERVSGLSLHEFTQRFIFRPLRMTSTGYFTSKVRGACAPTLPGRICVPHDPTAFHFFPKQTGHAGVFSTAGDMVRFSRMFLKNGELDGARILRPLSIKKMTVLPSGQIRGLGWDLLSPYADAPRGEVFPEGISYGHTGYTGTTLWIDPRSGTFYVFLSNRVFMGDSNTQRDFIQLRREVSTAIGNQIY